MFSKRIESVTRFRLVKDNFEVGMDFVILQILQPLLVDLKRRKCFEVRNLKLLSFRTDRLDLFTLCKFCLRLDQNSRTIK